MTKIAVFSKRDQKIIYVTDIVTCFKFAKISSTLELRVNEMPYAIRLDQLNEYIIGEEEMKEILMMIDRTYETLFDEYNDLLRKAANLCLK